MRKNYTGDRVLASRSDSRNPGPIVAPEKGSIWPAIIVAIFIAGGFMVWLAWSLP